MEYKAKQYGIDGIEFISYEEFSTILTHKKEYVIDELEYFVKSAFGNSLIAYTLSKE